MTQLRIRKAFLQSPPIPACRGKRLRPSEYSYHIIKTKPWFIAITVRSDPISLLTVEGASTPMLPSKNFQLSAVVTNIAKNRLQGPPVILHFHAYGIQNDRRMTDSHVQASGFG